MKVMAECEYWQKVDAAGSKFKQSLSEGLCCACVSCHRLLYRHSVRKFVIKQYSKCSKRLLDIATSGKLPNHFDKDKMICFTCHNSLKKAQLPAQSVGNGLQLDLIPEDLRELSTLERHIVGRRIAFMKLLSLPKGGQLALRGAVVNVPVAPQASVDILPRVPQDQSFVLLKLKRKLRYSGHYMYGNINVQKVNAALEWLKSNNELYQDVAIQENWDESWQNEAEVADDNKDDSDSSDATVLTDDNAGGVVAAKHSIMEVDDVNYDTVNDTSVSAKDRVIDSKEVDYEVEDQTAVEQQVQLRGIPYDTCLQREDDDDEINDEEIVSIAPGEQQRPIQILSDEHFEELAFPNMFPLGRGGFKSTQRQIQLTPRKYFNQRLLDCDGRFAQDTDYLFSAQYAVENKQIKDSVSIAMRQARGGAIGGQRINAAVVRDSEKMHAFIRQDEAYRCLTNVRGSPAYWKQALLDVLAMIRSLGVPTWFLSLSAADLRWPDVFQMIGSLYGETLSEEEINDMSWERKCSYVRRNPVVVARHFDFRLKLFLRDFLKSTAEPIGKIVNYFIRIEYQQRGSPHIHSLIWIQNAPQIDKNSDAEVCEFIDNYQTCSIPTVNDELKELVVSLQKHSHSKGCRKKSKECRFHFPCMPSPRTMIVRGISGEEYVDDTLENMNKARVILKEVRDVLEESLTNATDEICSLDEILETVKVSRAQYEWAVSYSAKKTKVVLKRETNESMINNYSPAVLKYWRANMDLQYVVDAYACVVYITSYMLKDETNMSELLKAAAEESSDRGIREQLNNVGSCFINHREVSAQEAVYRLLSLNLRGSSSTVVFINAGPPESRVSLLRPVAQLETRRDDDEDVFENSLIDKYAARPTELEDLCLADFAANYISCTSTRASKKAETVIELVDQRRDKTIGFMRKRKKPALIRYPRFKDGQENYYRARLMLFAPWRTEDCDLCQEGMTFRECHETKRERILQAEQKHVQNIEAFDTAMNSLEELEKQGIEDDMWDELAPNAIADSAECQVEGRQDVTSFDEQDRIDEDYSRPPALFVRYRCELSNLMSQEHYCAAFRTLNREQKKAVEFNRQWLKQFVTSINNSTREPEPYFAFLSGPGGVGKSHVIKLVETDCVRLLRNCRYKGEEMYGPEDICVLITASTGVAAFNVNGMTLHSAFQLRGLGTPKLSAEKLNSLRNSLSKLTILIIDEVSMVGADLLIEVDLRLRQIMSRDQQFGGVSVLAVGDLYQLPPVQHKSVFSLSSKVKYKLYGSAWQEHVKLIELTENMRQENQQFAEMLNRIRVGQCTDEDEETLRSRILTVDRNSQSYPVNTLHIFATNNECAEYNDFCINKLGTEQFTLDAIDSKLDSLTKQVQREKLKLKQNETRGLRDVVVVAVGAKVMLTCNLDVSDGLANGALGVVKGIITNKKQKKDVDCIQVKFDSEAVGREAKLKNSYRSDFEGCVAIARHEVVLKTGKGSTVEITRSQFPLTLAFACTIHKVQGLTLDSVVVSMKARYFTAGQVYVALSRVRSLGGLYLLDFNRNKIKASPEVAVEMARLRTSAVQIVDVCEVLKQVPVQILKVCHLNVRSFRCHKDDIVCSEIIQLSDVVCFNETDIRHGDENVAADIPWTGSQNYHAARCDGDEQKKGGGVMVAVKELQSLLVMSHRKPGVEAVVVQLHLSSHQVIHVCSLYRHPSSKREQFKDAVSRLLAHTPADVPLIVVGDVNDELVVLGTEKHQKVRPWINEFMSSAGFEMQLLPSPTTDRGSVIDHVYSKNCNKISVEVVDCYFSDHNILVLLIDLH